MPTRNLRDGELVIRDGSQSPNTITLTLHDGDLSWTRTSPVVNVLDRGDLSHMRRREQEPVTGRFTLKFVEFVSSGAPADPSPYEALHQIGAAAGWTSTNDDNGDVYTLELVFTISNPDPSGGDETVTFAKLCPTEVQFHEGDECNTLRVDFQDFETSPTID